MVYAPWPLPSVPGSFSELRPRQPQPVRMRQARNDKPCDHCASHGVPLGGTGAGAGTINPCRPWLGSVESNRQPPAAVCCPLAALGATKVLRCVVGGLGTRRRLGTRGRYVRIEPVFAVGDLVGPCRGTHERVEADRREVVLAVLDDRSQILHTQLRADCFAPRGPRTRLSCRGIGRCRRSSPAPECR